MRFRTLCLVASTLLLTAPLASAQSATVNYGSPAQTIRGFGGATGFQPQLTGAQATTIFGTGSNQLGLSILRVRIDPGGAVNWGGELANAQLAQAQGASIIAAVWTPPASMKSNGSTIMGSLNPSSYAAYAAYLNSYTSYLASNGVTLYAISMQNEPDANVSYESCTWTGAQMDTWIAQNASVLTTKLIMPESQSFTTSYSDPALNDPNAVGLISIIGGHLYGASPSYYTNAESKGKEVWMTEHYLNPSTGAQPAIADAISMAQEIHNSMTVGFYNAYVWWWIEDEPSISSYIGMVDANNNPSFYGLALGQFAKFIRPGYVRVSATANPVNGVSVSAYKGNGNYVIVAINSNTSAASLPVAIQGQTITSFTPYQTSATESMAQLNPIAVSGGTFTDMLPPQSITTFVGTASTAPGFALSASVPALSLVQGQSGTDTITVTDLNGFTGGVTLAASGLPAGVTAAFGVNPTTGSSALTLTTSATATTGTSSVTITGTSGALTATTSVALTITSGSCTPTAITPYIQVNGAAWQQIATATVASGSTVNLGPQPLGGTWSWTGPNGFTSAVREIDGIPLTTGANSYVATYINASACKSTQTFTITVGGSTPSFTLSASAPALSISPGNAGTDTITVTGAGGFTGSVTLAVSGLPTGVTAALGTNPTTGTSLLTLTAGATATAGTSTVTVKGTSGTLTASTTIALTVSATPSFTLSASAPTLSIAQGSSGTDTISVTGAGGFTGSVTLAVSGLPTGVTAALGTNPTTGTSVVTFTAGATAATAASTVTIKGTSGTLSASTTITLTVTTGGTGGFACHVGYSITNQWQGGFGAALTIGNTGTTAISNWTLTWTFANGQTVTQLWNGNATQSGANVTVTNMSYDGSIPTGGSLTSVGFNGSWNNVTNALPTNFAVNGTACK